MAPTEYVTASSPSGLSRLEDEQVVEFARAGCSWATEYLLKKYRGFVEGKARSYFLVGAEHEDVVQEGMIGLYKAIRDFQAERRAHFRSFVELCVTRQIITAVKSAGRNKHALLSDCMSLEWGRDEGEGCLLDIVSDPRTVDPGDIVLQRRTMREIRAAATDDLSRLEREVLRRYLQGRTYQEIAVRLKRPPKTVDNALQRAKRKVSHRLCAVESAA